MQASSRLKVEGSKSDIAKFGSACGWDVFISSFLQSFTGGSGQDVSCELNKSLLACSSLSRRQR